MSVTVILFAVMTLLNIIINIILIMLDSNLAANSYNWSLGPSLAF